MWVMWGEWLQIALWVLSAKSAAAGTGTGTGTGTVLTTPDVSAKWLEGFRRDLLRESYDYGPAPDTPGPRRGAGGPQGTLGNHEALPGSNGNSSADDVASSELGISRRDLYGPKDGTLLTDVELEGEGPRRPFLENLHELEEQLKPVYVKPGAGAPNRQSDRRIGFRKSRKRNEDNSIEDVEEKTPYIVQGGIKRYKVHTDPKQRFRNQFGHAEPFLPEEWGIKAQETRGPNVPESESEDSRYGSEENDKRLPYNQGYEDEARGDGNEDRLPYKNENEDNESDDGKRYNAQQDVHVEQRYRDDRSGSSSGQDRGESVEQLEQDVSEYKQEHVRSRYVEGLRRSGVRGGYAERFAARKDAALLTDGLASRKPCDCGTEHPEGPEL